MSNLDLKFIPLTTLIDPSFWKKACQLKLDVWKLDESPITISGAIIRESQTNTLKLHLSSNSFAIDNPKNRGCDHIAKGKFICFNTNEAFLSSNKIEATKNLFIKDLEIYKFPTNEMAIWDFALAAFLDLKHHKHLFWVTFPTFTFEDVISKYLDKIENDVSSNNRNSISEGSLSPKSLEILNLHHILTDAHIEFELLYQELSTHPKYPGWTLKNIIFRIIVLLSRVPGKMISIKCTYMATNQSETITRIYHFKSIESVEEILLDDIVSRVIAFVPFKEHHRVVDIGKSLDPYQLEKDASLLNLKLMTWRIAPGLKLNEISTKKCLIVGAGVLGCHIARLLLAWGVENITFIDCKSVSFSNPVRQTLYQFSDCIPIPEKMKFSKAEVAANALKQISPRVKAQGINLQIPVPGSSHDPTESHEIQQKVELLEKLIAESDSIFLVTDSRESRWLVTLIAAAMNKLVITAAVGFDGLLVMRHGSRDQNKLEILSPPSQVPQQNATIASSNLGCYFCSDIFSPRNSQMDRSLDQQCTVSQPGVSMIASAHAVELFATIMQNSQQLEAPAIASPDFHSNRGTHSFNNIPPHQIRFSFNDYRLVVSCSYAYSQCCACSPPILDAYKTQSFGFLWSVFNDSSHIDRITGTANIISAAENEMLCEFPESLSNSEASDDADVEER